MRARRVRVGWLASGVVLLLAAAVIALLRIAPQSSGSPASSTDLTRLTHDGGLTTQPSVSDDGEVLVYASDRAGGQLDVWLQRKGAVDPVRLTSDPADDHEPSLSPDGGRVVFRSERHGGGIYVMPTHTGGQPTLIAEGGHNPRFSPDGRHIAYWAGFAGARGDPGARYWNKTFVVSANGGEPAQLLPDFATAFWPVWAPDSKHVLVTAATVAQDQEMAWYVVPIDGGPPVHLKQALHDKYKFSCFLRQELWRGDTIVFSAMQADTMRLWRTQISSSTWQVGETAEQLTPGTEDHAFASASASDRLVFASTTIRQNIWMLPVAVEEGRVVGPIEQLTNRAQHEMLPGLSLDGTTLAFVAANGRTVSTQVVDLKTRESRVVVPPGPTDWMSLSPDGSRIAYRRLVEEPFVYGIDVVSTRGGEPERVCADCGWSIVVGWAHDNRHLLFESPENGMRIFALDLATGSHQLAAERSPNDLFQAQFSPDDRWMAIQKVLPTQQSRLWVAPVDRAASDPTSWIPVTTGEGWDDKPRWSPTGSLLYFMSQRDGFRCIWAQRLDLSTRRPKDAPFAVYHFHNGRLSSMNVPLPQFSIDVARDRLVFNLGEVTGNIWSTQAPLHSRQTATLLNRSHADR